MVFTCIPGVAFLRPPSDDPKPRSPSKRVKGAANGQGYERTCLMVEFEGGAGVGKPKDPR